MVTRALAFVSAQGLASRMTELGQQQAATCGVCAALHATVTNADVHKN